MSCKKCNNCSGECRIGKLFKVLGIIWILNIVPGLFSCFLVANYSYHLLFIPFYISYIYAAAGAIFILFLITCRIAWALYYGE